MITGFDESFNAITGLNGKKRRKRTKFPLQLNLKKQQKKKQAPASPTFWTQSALSWASLRCPRCAWATSPSWCTRTGRAGSQRQRCLWSLTTPTGSAPSASRTRPSSQSPGRSSSAAVRQILTFFSKKKISKNSKKHYT